MNIAHITLLVLALVSTEAVQLSELFTSNDFRFFPRKIHTFPDDSVLLWAGSTYSVREHNLHPIVTIDETQLLGDELYLVARVYSKNLTVIWAAAVTSLEDTVDSTIDRKGNAYIVGTIDADDIEGRAPLSIIKFAPDGRRLYTTNTRETDKRKDSGASEAEKRQVPVFPTEWLVNAYSGDIVHYVKPRTLVLSVAKISQTGKVRFGVALFDARTGDFLRLIQLPLPAFLKGDGLEQHDFTASSRRNVACYLFLRRMYIGLDRSSRVVVQCASLKGNHIVARELPEPQRVEVDDVKTNIEEPIVNCGRPILRVAFTRFFQLPDGGPDGESKTIRQMVIHRLDASTLENVDWASGKGAGTGGKVVDPMIVSLPAGSPHEVRYTRKANALSILLSATTRFRNITQQPHGGNVMIEGDGSYVIPSIKWVFNLNQERVLSAQKVPNNPRRRPRDRFNFMRVTHFDLSASQKKFYFHGYLARIKRKPFLNEIESGPLHVHGMRRKSKPLRRYPGRWKRWWYRHFNCYLYH